MYAAGSSAKKEKMARRERARPKICAAPGNSRTPRYILPGACGESEALCVYRMIQKHRIIFSRRALTKRELEIRVSAGHVTTIIYLCPPSQLLTSFASAAASTRLLPSPPIYTWLSTNRDFSTTLVFA